ncbi:MAG TPA: potassium transporter TrkG [Egibacteraceae bacterium]|nr:potassium transporter TrkG [Egibacteraceae bacterium]
MLFRPSPDELRVIGFYTGRVVYGIGAAMLVPLAVAVGAGEGSDAYAFVIGASLAIMTGAASQLLLRTHTSLDATRGLTVVALAWIVAPLFGAVPLLLSGHYASYLDAYFEGMSAFATVGLTLANDLDHMARGMNLWRHLMQMIGGLGIILVVLTIFARAGAAIGTLHTGEGPAERILPNIEHTAKFVLRVVVAYAAIGTSLLWLLLWRGGLDAVTGAYHAVLLFMTSFHTAGFAAQTASAAFYRSPAVEAVLMVLMVAGAFSFALHYQLSLGRRRELSRNIETRTLAVSILALFSILAVGLARTGTHTDLGGLFRVGFFQTVSAHTTTGLTTIPDRLFVTDWGALAPAVIVSAMALGGMAGSTAGGIKAIRIGVLLKGLRRDVRKVLLPDNAVVVESYHATTRRVLRDDLVRGAATILLLYLMLYLGGGLLGLFYGYDLTLSLFESTAAGSTGGLSVGLLRPGLEWPLKVVFIAQMLMGRLEFLAVLALGGYVVSVFRGRL